MKYVLQGRCLCVYIKQLDAFLNQLQSLLSSPCVRRAHINIIFTYIVLPGLQSSHYPQISQPRLSMIVFTLFYNRITMLQEVTNKKSRNLRISVMSEAKIFTSLLGLNIFRVLFLLSSRSTCNLDLRFSF
jgi:hypothetical protein